MKLTWLGHSAFRVETGGAVIVIDPFLTGNPTFKGDVKQATADATHVLLTHGHDDHLGDAAEIAIRTGAQLVSNFEICMFLAARGVKNINPGNTGGTVSCGDFTVTFTQALHSSSASGEGGKAIYLGNPNGMVITPKRDPVVYHFGDTDIFSDMALIDELYRPKVGLIPIGDRFTMGARTAALALKRFFHLETVIPCHFATFDMIAASADAFVKEMAGQKTKVLTPNVGDVLTL